MTKVNAIEMRSIEGGATAKCSACGKSVWGWTKFLAALCLRMDHCGLIGYCPVKKRRCSIK